MTSTKIRELNQRIMQAAKDVFGDGLVTANVAAMISLFPKIDSVEGLTVTLKLVASRLPAVDEAALRKLQADLRAQAGPDTEPLDRIGPDAVDTAIGIITRHAARQGVEKVEYTDRYGAEERFVPVVGAPNPAEPIADVPVEAKAR